MVESALNVAAEQVVEWSAYGNLMHRDGNRSPLAAPQGLYPCAGGEPGAEKWLALSIATDAQWRALCGALGDPEWAWDAALETAAGRHEAPTQVALDATGSDSGNSTKQNKDNGKTEDETQGVQQNRQANLGIRMFVIKLTERQPGNVGQVRGN